MNSEDGFKQQLAEKLLAATNPNADQKLWLKIEARVTPRQRYINWQWYGLAASFCTVAFWAYLNVVTPQFTESAQIAPQLFFLDVELQQALLTAPDSEEIQVLLEKRKALQTKPTRSYQL